MRPKLEYLQIARGVAALLVVLLHINGRANFSLYFSPFGGIFRKLILALAVYWAEIDRVSPTNDAIARRRPYCFPG
jgi:peptidoglycan/LPS O-acetylase OafA/YrhL